MEGSEIMKGIKEMLGNRMIQLFIAIMLLFALFI